MTRAIAIAAREIRERKFVFLMAALAALIPFMAALLPATKHSDPLTVIVVTCMSVAIAVTFGLSVVLGGSIVSRELAERRLSFYLSKPVSAAAIWFGKLTGAIVIVGVAFAIIFLPSFVVAHSAWTPTWNVPVELFVATVLGAAAYLLLVSHALSTMVRSRSPLIALDLALLAVTVLAVWLLVRPLLDSFALGVAQTVMVVIVATVGVAIAAAGAWQISRGRTDIKRSHRELSRFFWTSIAVVIAIAGAYVGWVFSAGPADLLNRVVLGNARGDWMIVSGDAVHRGDYRPTFLVNLKNGKSMRFPSTRWVTEEFTRRGDAVVVVAPLSDWGRMMNRGELHVQTLDAPRARTGTGIETTNWSRTVVSDDLRRVAIFSPSLSPSSAHSSPPASVSSDLLSVYDLQSKALLGSARIPQASAATLYFVSPDVVRVYATSWPTQAAARRDLRIFEFNVAKRQLRQTGQFTTTAKMLFSRASADGSLIVLTRLGVADQPRVMILDGRSASQLGKVDARLSGFAKPLTGGRIAFVEFTNGHAVLRIFDSHGTPVQDVALGRGSIGGGVREVIPGRKLIASVFRRGMMDSRARGWDVYVVDAAQGVVERVEHDFGVRMQTFGSDDPRVADPDPTGEFVATDAMGAIIRWNALTGARRKVL